MSEVPELRWLQGNPRGFLLDIPSFRADLSRPALVDKLFCSHAVDNPQLYVGGQLVTTGECIPAKPEEVDAVDEEDQAWFEMRFFLNRPQLPLHLVAYTEIELQKSSPGNWPIMAYREGPVIEPAANPSSCFVPVQRLDGRWNVILFRFGRAGLRAVDWVDDPKDLEDHVPGFKLSPDLKIA